VTVSVFKPFVRHLQWSVMFLLAAVPALAQESAVRVNLGVSGGVANPLHADFAFTAASWQADARVDPWRHFGFDIFFEEWRHSDEQVFTNGTISGPGGPIGRVDRVTTRTDHRTRTVGWSLLARGGNARLTGSGGGGVSYLQYSSDFRQMMTGCQPASLCSDSSQPFDNGSFALQAQAGVDIAVAPHTSALAQFRLIVPVQDPAGGHSSFMGGVRFGF
jgi:hypothetical protein